MRYLTSALLASLLLLGSLGCLAQTTQVPPAAVARTSAPPLYPVAVGHIVCADKVVVSIHESPLHQARYDIKIGKSHYVGERIVTDSGAVKLEDKNHGIVWLQMANKSMLFNEKIGKRLATDCQNDDQKAAHRAMEVAVTP